MQRCEIVQGRTLPLQSLSHRQTEIKNGPMSQLAGDADASAVGFDDGFADRQPHSCSVYPDALVLAAVELFEDQSLLEVVDAGAAIGDAGGQRPVFGLCGNANRSAGR